MRVRLSRILFAFVIIVGIPLYWITMVMNSADKSCNSVLEERILDLRERLQKADSSNMLRANDLKVLRDQFNYLRNSNIKNRTRHTSPTKNVPSTHQHMDRDSFEIINSNNSLYIPSIFSFLPYLRNSKNSLQPAFTLSQHRTGMSMVFGVPTVSREKESYLIATLTHLINGLEDSELDDTLIIVFVGEPNNLTYVKSVARDIQEKLPQQVASGLIEVISPPPAYYPDFSQLRTTLNDSPERVRWRTKQNLDFAFLMLYAKSRGVYYTQLEDDVVAKPRYSLTMKSFVTSQTSDDWMLLEFSQLGFIGKTFKTRDLPLVASFFFMFHNDKPVDWLLDHLLTTKYCNPEKPIQHCRKVVGEVRIRYKPSLFQHVGIHSSLKGKVQKLKDRDFGKSNPMLVKSHKNPPAELSTSLTVYQKYTLDRAYKGETIFWGVNPEPDDTVEFNFKQPIKLKRFLFRTGNPEHPGDKFVNTSVEVLPRSHINDNGAILENLAGYKTYADGGQGYLVIGHFDASGVCEGAVDLKLGPISSLRLRVLSKSPSWVILSEILLEELR